VRLLLVAAAALIDPACRVLIAQRPQGKTLAGLLGVSRRQGRSGRAGGRGLDPGTARGTPESASRKPALRRSTFASFAYPDFHLLMPLYICRRWSGFVEAREIRH